MFYVYVHKLVFELSKNLADWQIWHIVPKTLLLIQICWNGWLIPYLPFCCQLNITLLLKPARLESFMFATKPE